MKHLNINVRGHVQGVGFRYSALKAAQSYGICGFIRNEPDGSVYIEAEGEKFNLGLVMDWFRGGPAFGRVDDVIRTESNLQGFVQFRILY